MCRSIKVLRRPGERATKDEMEAAARQFVRKISGFHKPSKKNEAAFEQAIAEVAEISRRLLEAVGTEASPARTSVAEPTPTTVPMGQEP